MVIYGVSFDMVGKQPIVLLKAVDTNKFLPIWIGHPEAAAILMKLQGASTPRPMTHDLLFDMLGELEVACTRVSVTELRENTFYASITLSVNGREVEIDSRPSDALALAVRSGAPIFAAEDVIAESAIEFEHEVEDTEEVVDKFKEFLDRVTPEDFAGNVMGDLSSRRGMVQGMDDMAGGGKIIKAEVPLSEMFGYSTTLRSMSQGRATYSMEFKHYSEAPKNVADAIITSRGSITAGRAT